MRDLKYGQIVDSFMDLHIGCAKGAEEGRKWLKLGNNSGKKLKLLRTLDLIK